MHGVSRLVILFRIKITQVFTIDGRYKKALARRPQRSSNLLHMFTIILYYYNIRGGTFGNEFFFNFVMKPN